MPKQAEGTVSLPRNRLNVTFRRIFGREIPKDHQNHRLSEAISDPQCVKAHPPPLPKIDFWPSPLFLANQSKTQHNSQSTSPENPCPSHFALLWAIPLFFAMLLPSSAPRISKFHAVAPKSQPKSKAKHHNSGTLTRAASLTLPCQC